MKTTMKRYLWLSVASIVAAFTLLAGTAYAGSGSTGKEFYLAFQPNTAAGTPTLSLFITGQQDTQGTVEIVGLNFNKAFTVKANQVTTVQIPNNAGYLPDNAVSKLAVHVVAQDDVTIYGLNTVTYTTDGFLALPIDALGLEYYALSYTTTYGSYPSQVALVGVYDNTQVTITPTVNANGHNAGVSFTVALNRGDTYQVSSVIDVTGMHIVSTAPVALMSGVNCANVPTTTYWCNHLVEMMPPVSAWGTSFLSVPLATRINGDVFRILASQDGTKVTVNGALVATLDKGKYFESVLKTRSQIDASAPVLLAQYSPGSTFDGVSADPFMMLIPPTEQFLNQYAFSTPATGFPNNYVNVVIPSGEVSHLLLDGASANANLFSPIGTSGFSGGQLPIAVGAHTLKTTSGVPFGIYIYGFYSYDGYGYLGGMSFNAINHFGDPYPPTAKLVFIGDTVQGTAIDGEDVSGNGVITPRSGVVNGLPVRDTGIFRVEMLADATNLQLNVVPFVPGALTANFSISRIDTTKPGTGTLHIEDGVGNKYEAPISLGATAIMRNVRVIETLSNLNIDIDPASFTQPPFSVTDVGNQKVIEWHFDTFAVGATDDLGFDILFKSPVPAENRLVSYKVELLYNDVNGNAVRTELPPQYVSVYPSTFQVMPATDKASYGANEVVQISTVAKNLSAFAASESVRLSIKDTSDNLVALLGTTSAQLVAAGGSGIFTGLNFQTGNNYVGNYKVLAELVDNTGKVITSGSAPFVIAAASGQSAKATITTDKQIYNPFDTVRISDRVTNLLSNATLDDLRVVTSVTNPDGSVRFSKTETLPQLSPGALKDYAYNVSLASATAGQYNATLIVTKADGTQLAQASTQFAVASTAETGAGLTGTITATPTLVSFGKTVNLAFSAANNGNSALANLPLKVSIVDPEKQQVVVEYPYSTTLAMGGSYNGSAAWLSSGNNGATYIALLSATIGGKTITLAQATFTVLKLDIKQALFNDSRVLVLLSCKNSEGNSADDKACIDARAPFLDATLTTLGIEHLVTVTPDDFRFAFRSGKYNVYWVSGGALKLDNGLAQEVREAVNRGDGLLLDGVHDERNGLLDEVAGVLYRGKLSPVDQPITLTGPLFAPGSLATAGRPLKLALNSGTQQAKFPAALKCDDCADKNDKDGTTPGDTPAIVGNLYGKGHGMIMAFDLVGSLAQTQPVTTVWQDIMQATLGYLMPQTPDPLTAGAYAVARTSLTNQGPAVALEVTDLLPPGAAVVSTTPQASVDADNTQAKWTLSLATGQGADLTLALRVPEASGSHTLTTTVNSTWNGQGMLYGSYPLTLNVASAMELAATSNLIADLQALSFNTSKEREARDQAVKALQDALAKTTQGKYEDAIGNLLDAIDKLKRITGKDMSAHRLSVDRWLQELELEWLLVQPLN